MEEKADEGEPSVRVPCDVCGRQRGMGKDECQCWLDAEAGSPWESQHLADCYRLGYERVSAGRQNVTPEQRAEANGPGQGNAAQPPPDSSVALREARRLLGEARDVIRQAQVEGEDHGDRCRGLATLAADAGKMMGEIRAFLGEREPERRENGKG